MINKIRRLFIKFSYSEYWKVIIKKSHQILLNFNDSSFELRSNFRYWLADPMLLNYKDQNFVFVEVFDRILGRGKIGYFNLNKQRPKLKIILNLPYHLSFPFIFLFENSIYMIPETSDNKTIQLFKAISFPNKWEKVKTLVDNIKAVDSIIYIQNKTIFLYTSVLGDNINFTKEIIYKLDSNFEILEKVFSTNEFLGDSRNAGPFIKLENNIYRIQQTSDINNYGLGVKLSKFVDINHFVFSKFISFAEVSYKNNNHYGFHTLSKVNNYIAIDLKYKRKNGIIKILFLILVYNVKKIIKKCKSNI